MLRVVAEQCYTGDAEVQHHGRKQLAQKQEYNIVLAAGGWRWRTDVKELDEASQIPDETAEKEGEEGGFYA